MSRRWPLVFALLLLLTGPAAAEPYEKAVLVGLDKVTARVTQIVAPVGQKLRYRTLVLVVHACDKTPPEELPESAAFMEIWEEFPDRPSRDLFSGWMFASSPGLNALEHPVYDVWVTDCVTGDPVAAPKTDEDDDKEDDTPENDAEDAPAD